MDAQLTNDRPWPVYVLVVAIGLGALWSLVVQDTGLGLRLLSFAISMAFAVALWKGITWVFILAFGAAALCALTVTFTAVTRISAGQASVTNTLMLLVFGWLPVILLVHPDTKRFARVERQTASV